MGVTKKPRKVTITYIDEKFAKDAGIPLSVVAKEKLPKRGRPVGSKNKNKTISSTGWVPPKPVDWEKLAKQLQEALAAEMKENETLEAMLTEVKNVVRIDSSFTFWDRLVFLFSGKL